MVEREGERTCAAKPGDPPASKPRALDGFDQAIPESAIDCVTMTLFGVSSAGTRICGFFERYGSRICSSVPGAILIGMLS
jgi:hypothetical protein